MVDNPAIFHGVALVAGEESGLDGFRQEVQLLAAFFYADDSLLASPRISWIQEDMDVLAGLFDRVCLHTNVEKTVVMV